MALLQHILFYDNPLIYCSVLLCFSGYIFVAFRFPNLGGFNSKYPGFIFSSTQPHMQLQPLYSLYQFCACIINGPWLARNFFVIQQHKLQSFLFLLFSMSLICHALPDKSSYDFSQHYNLLEKIFKQCVQLKGFN